MLKTTNQITDILEVKYGSAWYYDACDKTWEGRIGGKRVSACYRASMDVVQILDEAYNEVDSFSVTEV